jgi:hypothetical protein
MKLLQLKRGYFLMPFVMSMMCLLLTSWLVPANAQFSGDLNDNRIFSILNGRIGPVGNTDVTYYTGDFYPEIKGKIKSIGNTNITYYTGDFYPEIKGKIKSIGNTDITYYTGEFYPEIKGRINQ